VKVQVVHDLTTLRPCIAGDTIATLPVPQALPEEPRDPDTVSNDRFVFRLETCDGLDVALGDDQQMDRCLRIEVLEGEHLLVLKFDLGRGFSGDDTAEHTAWDHVPLEVVYTRMVDHGQQRSIIEGDVMGTCPKCKLRIRKNGNHVKLGSIWYHKMCPAKPARAAK
jgi:hypothetical protein